MTLLVASDYKPRIANARGNSVKKKRAAKPVITKSGRLLPSWAWASLGFALGLAAAAAIHISLKEPVERVTKNAAQAIQKPDTNQAYKAKTRFEFYSLLPEMEVVVPEGEVAIRSSLKAPRANNKTPARFVLQAGAFRSLADADRLRASLALAGMEASIQTVSVDGKETWHRVRLGPYTDIDAMNAIRTRLRRASIDAMVLRIKT